MRRSATCALLLLAAGMAHASERVPEFGSAALERRASTVDVPEAGRAAWDAFRSAHPGPWRAEWDPRSGMPRQIWGASFALVPEGASASQVEAAVRAELAPLARVPMDLLRTAVLEKRRDTWFVRFARVTREGTPVAGAYAEARVTRGRLVLLRVETHPDAERSLPAPRLSRAAAIRAAGDGIVSRRTIVTVDATFVIAPIAAGAAWSYRPAYDVVTRATTRETWRTRVDAVYGEVLARELLTPSLDGRFTGLVEPRTVGDALVERPLPWLLVSTTGAGTAVTASDGRWTFVDPGPLGVSAELSGPFFHVTHATLAEGVVSFEAAGGAADHAWSAPLDATQAEIAAYRHASTVREWALGQAPSVEWLQTQVEVHVGITGQCNALYDGTIVLYGEGSNCNDTARIADVTYHEYGHGFHQHVRVGGLIDPTIGEGIGDYVSATLTNSPRIGLALLKNDPGDGALRDIEEDRIYPDDVSGEVHADGTIFAGAMWDARTAFIAERGYDLGVAAADALFTKIVEAGPTLDQVFVEALLADDDDANLANGTPNRCLLEVAFGIHGLTGASGLFSLLHEEVAGEIPAGEPVPIHAQRPQAAAFCAESEITSAVLHWFVAGEEDEVFSAALTSSGETFSGEIGPGKRGEVVRYWFESALETGLTVLTPPRGPENTFAFHVGPVEVIWRDDFETETGWESGGESPDWQIGAPQGLGGDPSSAHSGTNVLGNTLDGDGRYPPLAASYIESPVIDCRRCENARLRFRRWGHVQQAVSDRVTAGIGGLPVWQNEQGIVFDDLSVSDPIWSYQEYDVSELADGGANIRIRFSLESDGFLEFGGLTIDDVEIFNPGGGGGGGRGCGCALDGRGGGGVPAAAVLVALAVTFGRRRRSAKRLP